MQDRPPRTPAVVCVYGNGVNGLGVVRSLGRAGAPTYVVGIAGDRNLAAFSRHCRKCVSAGRLDRAELVATLTQLADELGGRPVLFFDNDKMMIELAPSADALAARYRLTVPLERITDFTDKFRQMEAARRAGLAVPKTWFPRTWHELADIGSEFDGKVIAKPSPAHFSADGMPFKVLVGANAAALVPQLEEVVESPRGIIVQRVIEGDDACVYAGAGYRSRDGRFSEIVTARKIHQSPRGMGVMAVGCTTDNEAVRAATVRLVSEMDYAGIFATEFKYCAPERQYYFVEINPRTPQFNTLCRRAGLDLALTAYRDATGSESPDERGLDRQAAKYWIYFGAVANAVLSDRSFRSWRDTLKLLYKRPEWAVWSLADPMPWFPSMSYVVRRVVRRVGRRLVKGRRGAA